MCQTLQNRCAPSENKRANSSETVDLTKKKNVVNCAGGIFTSVFVCM